MKLSTRARHAVTAMMDLAINDQYEPVTLADISRCQGISLSYLEQLFAKPRKSGLVIGVRGPGGGYRLARSPYEISIAQVVSAIDGHAEFSIQFNEAYLTHQIWDKLSARIYRYLDGMSLGEFTDCPEYHTRRVSGKNRSHMFPRKTAA